jgi:hypothetical protein
MKIELAKQLYDSEWARRDQLAGAVTVPISVVTGLAGGIALLVSSYSFDTSLVTTVFWFLVVIAISFLLLAGFWLVRSYHGYEYEQIPSPAELEKYDRDLIVYYEAMGEAETGRPEFESYLGEKYIEAAEQNAHNNGSRAAFLYQATRSIILALIATGLVLMPWAINAAGREPSPQHIVIDQTQGGHAR